MTDKHKPLAEMKKEWELKNGRPFPGRGKSAPAATPAAAAPTPATPEQVEAVRQALAVRYSGMVHAYAAEHKCSKSEAMIAVNKTKAGAEARLAYIKNANPGRGDDLFEQAPEAPAAAAGPYTGPDYMTLAEEHKEKKGGTIVDAMMHVNRKHPAARADFIRRHNPHLVE